MKTLELQNFKYLVDEATKEARKSTCQRRKCGSVVFDTNHRIIGRGHNSPPANTQPRCHIEKTTYHQKVTDKTCCIHAEQRAIINTLIQNPAKIRNSSLLFISIDKNQPTPATKPYCTICSKMAIDIGIANFILLTNLTTLTSYNTEEYNDLSFSYKE